MPINITNPNFKPEYDTHAASLVAHMDDWNRLTETGNGYEIPLLMWSISGTALVANQLYGVPFFVARDKTYDRIAVEVSTLKAGSSIRLGIYNDGTNLYPGTRLVDAGTVSGASTGVKTITIDQELTKGFYWLALVSDDTPSIYTGYIYNSVLGMSPSDFSAQLNGWRVAFTYAALPTPFTASGTRQTARMPEIGLRPSAMS